MDDLGYDIELVAAEPTSSDQSDGELDRTGSRLRLELLANTFAAEPVQLKDIKTPPECYVYQDQGEEIFFTYLSLTVFHVKVWVNFDACEEVFFEGVRSTACGKLQLPEHVYESIAILNPADFKLQHVCFEIGTPFRTLAVVDLVVEHGEHGAAVRAESEMTREHDNKHRLFKYMQYCCRNIERIGLAYGIDGLTLQDLEHFASLFHRDRQVSPGRNEDWENPAYEGGEWAGVEKPRRFGGGFTRHVYWP